jgi:hypothetical protein
MTKDTGAAKAVQYYRSQFMTPGAGARLRPMRVSGFKAEQNLNGQPICQETKRLKRKKSFGLILNFGFLRGWRLRHQRKNRDKIINTTVRVRQRTFLISQYFL